MGSTLLSFTADGERLIVKNGTLPYVVIVDMEELTTNAYVEIDESARGVAVDSKGEVMVLTKEEVKAVSILGAASGTLSSLVPVLNTNVIPQTSFGRFYKGRTLHLALMEIKRTPEVRYRTIDSEDVIRHYRLLRTEEDLEMVMVRLRVQNHTATSAVFTVDQQAAELRDSLARIPHLAQTSDAVNRQLSCFSSRYMNLLAVFQI